MKNSQPLQQDYSYKSFAFDNAIEDISAALQSMSAYISEAVISCGNGNGNSIVLRSGWVLAELLTNASKHSKDNFICFEIHVKNAVLEIVRSECGDPFPLSVNSRINSFSAIRTENKRFVIQKDDLCVLYATVCKNGALLFEAEDIEIMDDTVREIIEHFGLIIITRSSDKFMYTYEDCTKTNVFTVSFNL